MLKTEGKDFQITHDMEILLMYFITVYKQKLGVAEHSVDFK